MKGLLDMTYTFSNGSYIGGRMPFLYVHGLLVLCPSPPRSSREKQFSAAFL